MIKKIFKNILIIVLAFSYGGVFGDCDFYELMEECREQNENGAPESVTEYLCVNSTNDEEILYNIILDKKFSVIDSKAEKFLDWLEKSKNYFYGTQSKSSFFQGVDIIGLKFSIFGEYRTQYYKLCSAASSDSIALSTLSCLSDEDVAPKSVTIGTTKDYFSPGTCMGLVETKLMIYEKVAYDIMKVNKASVRKDNRKRFMQNQRTKYGELMELMRINIGYMERIWKKWPSKTTDAYSG